MTDEQLLRYSRHILLDDLGVEGQRRLLQARVLLIGAGGLGATAGLFLGTAGIGALTVVDHDEVDATNLQRQIAHTAAAVGQPKVQSLRDAIAARNPDVRVTAVAERADEAMLIRLVGGADVVLDCTDNFASRHAINRACVAARKPLVSGAAIRMDGQLAVYDPRREDSPCYACLFPPDSVVEETRCATMGVFAPLVGIVGSMQAAEALKLAAALPVHTVGRLLLLDARRMQWTDVRIPRSAHCPVCGSGSD